MPEKLSMLDLRANLSEILRRVEAGEAFEITRFGKVVAIITRATEAEKK